MQGQREQVDAELYRAEVDRLHAVIARLRTDLANARRNAWSERYDKGYADGLAARNTKEN